MCSSPKIEEIKTYKGTICHSADWDTSIDWKEKRVAVIESDSIVVQLTPLLAQDNTLKDTSRWFLKC
jgi:cation diffusion facilitator CzcD-associated flavoprotein CzcO